MNKTIKILSIVLLVMMIVLSVSNVFAADTIISQLETDVNSATADTTKVSAVAGKVIKMIRNVAVIGGVIILVILGCKYMMGSVEEKAGYQKSLIPLVVGIVVIMGATSIASFLFELM